MPAVVRCLLLALNLLLLSAPPLLEPRLGASRAFLLVTAVIIVLNITLAIFWDRLTPRAGRPPRVIGTIPFVVAGVVPLFLFTLASRWLREILIYPHDAMRADMLVVIQLGIKRLLQGGDPYTMYHVPWDVTLPYGPMMWGPLILPHLLHADVRFVTLLGFLFVPVACAMAAAKESAVGRWPSALGWASVAAAIAFSPALTGFVSVGHTATNWPLLALFAWLVTQERWRTAAFTAGLLIVARTTMVSVVPVLLITVWYRDRRLLKSVLPLIIVTAIVPFLPFAIWDPAALKWSLYTSYGAVTKAAAWPSIVWREHLIGTTGLLLQMGWGRFVEILQVVALLAVYAICIPAIRAGRRPLPWMALALLVFSMTAVWPVTYLYYDVCLLLICGALSDIDWVRSGRVSALWPGTLAMTVVTLAMAVAAAVPVNATIDAGSDRDRPYLYSGFSSDEREGDRTFSWVNGTRAEILVARRSRRDATIEIVCEPHVPRGTTQQLSASLNGVVIGTTLLKDGWQTVEFAAPGRAWQYGVNELTVFLSTAISPKELSLSDDGRKLSLAVDRLTVRTP